jgi:CTP:molybdopterin cytidylyltransferase MocA
MLAAFPQHSGQPAQPVAVRDRVYHDLCHTNGLRAMSALYEMGSAGLGASILSV